MEGECSETGTAVDDRSDARGYQPVDFADVRRRGVEHVVDAYVLHQVEVHHEVAKDALHRGDGGKDGVVESVHGVEDWHCFCENAARKEEYVDFADRERF